MDGEWCYQDDPCRGCTIVILQDRVTALEAAVRTVRDCLSGECEHTDCLETIDNALAPGAGGPHG
jgi:hypothetical protein